MDRRCDVCHSLTFDANTQFQACDGLISDSTLFCPRTQADIRESGISGCKFCEAVSKAVDTSKAHEDDVFIQINLDGRCLLVVERAFLQLYCPPGLPPAWPGVLVSAELPTSSFSQSSLGFMRDSLEQCSSQHTACQQLDPKLPTRLIDIHPKNDTFRIVETRDDSTGQYIALSYCWGSSKFSTLTTQNTMSEWKTVAGLPKSIRDAIMVTGALGLRYLWVDALCIIQDSVEDWQNQSSKMGSVYRNAYLTIAASSASSADAGFLGPFTDHIERRTTKLPWTNNYGEKTILKVRWMPEHRWTNLYEPLQNRAWTYQERVLSTRIVTFGNDEVRWKCLSSESCQCQFLGHEQITDLAGLSSFSTLQEACIVWHDIVTSYSGRCLTYTRDRLAALSGLARLIPKTLLGPYIAGLWLPTLIQDLCWMSHRGQPWSTDPVYIAPTFSWASICRQTFMVNERSESFTFVEKCHVIRAETTLTNIDPFGQVKGGSIKLRGCSISSTLIAIPRTTNRHEYKVPLKGGQFFVRTDTNIDTFTFSNVSGQTETSVCRSWDEETSLEKVNGTSVHVFLLGYTILGDRYRLHWLVLGRSPRDQKFYERVGYFNVCFQESEWLEWEDMLNGHGTETITIV